MTKTRPSATNCVRAATATVIAAIATRSRLGEGVSTACSIASTAQRKAGYAADSVITKPDCTFHGSATERNATSSDQRPESDALRESRYAGTAALAKRIPLR